MLQVRRFNCPDKPIQQLIDEWVLDCKGHIEIKEIRTFTTKDFDDSNIEFVLVLYNTTNLSLLGQD